MFLVNIIGDCVMFLLLAWHANALQSESEEKYFSNFEGLYTVTVSF